jgi:hypothetical protein
MVLTAELSLRTSLRGPPARSSKTFAPSSNKVTAARGNLTTDSLFSTDQIDRRWKRLTDAILSTRGALSKPGTKAAADMHAGCGVWPRSPDRRWQRQLVPRTVLFQGRLAMVPYGDGSGRERSLQQ